MAGEQIFLEFVGNGVIYEIVDENKNVYMQLMPQHFQQYETSKPHLDFYCCVLGNYAIVSSRAKCKKLIAYRTESKIESERYHTIVR